MNRTRGLGPTSRQSLVIWGFVNQIPRQFRDSESQNPKDSTPYVSCSSPFLGAYIHDQNRLLLVMYRKRLRPWLRELILYHGAQLKGLLQILPTVGSGQEMGMGDVLCRAIHHEANFPMNQLRVRFYAAPGQLLGAHKREREGLLTFEASDFLNLLEMVSVFRRLLNPEQQKKRVHAESV